MMRAVVKLGGSVLVDPSLRNGLLSQIAQLRRANLRLILVHGGGQHIASLLDRLGIESHFHDGLRVTDEAARDAVQMALAGQVGKDLVAELAMLNVAAVSIAGGDGQSFLAEKMLAEDGTDLGFVGRIVKTDSNLVEAIISARLMPVVACLALGHKDHQYYNINGDQMAAAVAAGCSADTLVFVTDVGGVKGAGGEQLAELDRARVNELLGTGVASGGMRPKLRACLEALDAGVKRILIVGAAEEKSLLRVLMQGEKVGTRIS